MAAGIGDDSTTLFAPSAASVLDRNSAAATPVSTLVAPYLDESLRAPSAITAEERARIAEAKLAALEARLAALEAGTMEQKDQVTGYAHDANNNHAAIAATLEEAVGASTPAEAISAVRNAQILLARQGVLLSNLFKASRQGHDAPTIEPVNLTTALEDLAKTLAIPTRHKKLTFALTSEVPALATHVKIDWLALSRVLSNLIGNAIKFTEHGGITLTVKAAIKSDTQVQLTFSITDTGIGMTEEERKRLFQRFVQANDEIKATHGGSGFGLYYCQNTIRSMGGDITVTSTKGVGTEFSFSIDCERVIALAAGASGDIMSAAEPKAVDLTGKTVLIVEDEKSIAKLVQRTLQRQGAICTHVSSAEDALALDLNAFDMALVDHGLRAGGKNGFQLAQAIRAAGLTMPIIAGSGEADDPSFQRQAAAIGFNACLAKPYSASALPRFIFDTIRAVAPATPTRGGAGISALTVTARPPALSASALVTAPLPPDSSGNPALAFAKSLSGNGSFSPCKEASVSGSGAAATPEKDATAISPH